MWVDSEENSRETPFWDMNDAALALANGLDDIKRLSQKDGGYYNPYHEDEKIKVSSRVADAIKYLYDNAPHPDGTVPD
jgi:hypothetical protein